MHFGISLVISSSDPSRWKVREVSSADHGIPFCRELSTMYARSNSEKRAANLLIYISCNGSWDNEIVHTERVMIFMIKSYGRAGTFLPISLSPLLFSSLSLHVENTRKSGVRYNVALPRASSTGETRQTIITSGGKQRCISPPSCTAYVVAKRYIYGPVGVIELWISGFGISSSTAPGCGRPPPSATITFLSAARGSIHPSRHVRSDVDLSTSLDMLTNGRFISLLTHGNIVNLSH